MKGKRNSIDEKPLRSSGPDFDRFINSTIWHDISNLVKDRQELLQQEFITATDMDSIRNIQGQMKAWKEVLGIPTYLKQHAHIEANNNKIDDDDR